MSSEQRRRSSRAAAVQATHAIGAMDLVDDGGVESDEEDGQIVEVRGQDASCAAERARAAEAFTARRSSDHHP